MIIEMAGNPGAQYGNVAKSTALFRITGRGVHSPHHPHQLIRWDFTGTQWEGTEDDGLRFSARAIVISSTPQEQQPTYDIAIGDTVTVDGQDYTVTAQPLADPALVPVS